MSGCSTQSKDKSITTTIFQSPCEKYRVGLKSSSCVAFAFAVITSLILAPLNAYARLCSGEPVACGKTDFCVTHVVNMTWASYEKWLNTGDYTVHEVLATSSTYIRVQYRDQCVEKDTCWDQQGTCLP